MMKKSKFAMTAVASALLAISMGGLVACSKGGSGDTDGGDNGSGTTYEITLNANGGTLATGTPNKITTGTDGKISMDDFPKAPTNGTKAFEGWYLNAEGTGAKVTIKTEFTADDEIFAKWGGEQQDNNDDDNNNNTTWTVTFNLEGGSWTEQNETGTRNMGTDGKLTSMPADPERTGYEFGGWFTAANGGGTAVNLNSTYTANSNVYAKWTEKSQEITDPNAAFTYGSIYSSGETEHQNKAILTGKFKGKNTEYDWKNGYYMTFNQEKNDGNGQYELIRIYLQAGDEMKIRLNGSDTKGVYSFIANDQGKEAPGLSHVKQGDGDTIIIKDTGYYTFEFKANYDMDGLWLEYSET